MKIALAGKQGAGKSELAKVFMSMGFKHLSFAKAVKETAMEEHGLTCEEAFGDKKNRELLQEIGHGYRVKHGLDFWVNKVVEKMNENPNENYILDDLRYKNEFDVLKKAGFIMVRINASDDVRKQRIGSRYGNPDHISETDLDDVGTPFEVNKERFWDVTIVNERIDMDRFRATAERIYKAFEETDENRGKLDNV